VGCSVVPPLPSAYFSSVCLGTDENRIELEFGGVLGFVDSPPPRHPRAKKTEKKKRDWRTLANSIPPAGSLISLFGPLALGNVSALLSRFLLDVQPNKQGTLVNRFLEMPWKIQRCRVSVYNFFFFFFFVGSHVCVRSHFPPPVWKVRRGPLYDGVTFMGIPSFVRSPTVSVFVCLCWL
jgi:hypothetical protein